MNENKKILAAVLLLAMMIGAIIIFFPAIPPGVVPKAAEEKMDSNLFYVVSNAYKSDKTEVISFTASFSNLSADEIIDLSNAETALLLFANDEPVYVNDTFLYLSSAESVIKLAQRMEVVQMNSFGTPEGVKKFDPLLRHELLTLRDSSQLDMELDIIISTRSELNETQRETLRDKGANIRSVIGKIITCSVQAKDIFEIAGLEFVERIEISKPLRLLRGE